MKIVKNAAVSAVTQVVTPAKPESFDLIGLSETDMALLLIILGARAHSREIPSELYDTIHTALGAGNSTGGIDRIVMSTMRHGELYSYRVKPEAVQALLDNRLK